MLDPLPTLKRGANYHCAYGARGVPVASVQDGAKSGEINKQTAGFHWAYGARDGPVGALNAT